MKLEQTQCSETSAYKIQTPGNYPKENIQRINTIYSECVFAPLVIQHAIRMRRSEICSLFCLYPTFPHYVTNGTFF